MYRAEVHETLDSVRLEERVTFELSITEAQYTSDHDIVGSLTLTYQPTKTMVDNREAHPHSPLSLLTDRLGVTDGPPITGFPGTAAHVGIVGMERTEDDGFEETIIEPDVDGLPVNDTVTVEPTWSLPEARSLVADGSEVEETVSYDVSGYPTDRLPIIVRAKFYRDAKELGKVIGLRGAELTDLEGLAALAIELEHQETAFGGTQPLRVRRFRVNMASTFPDIAFHPRSGSTYNPEQRRVEWSEKNVAPGSTINFAIMGPLTELDRLGAVTAELRGTIEGHTLSGRAIAGVYDESGERIPSGPDVEHLIRVRSPIEIDPDALSGEVRKRTKTTIRVGAPPQVVFDELVAHCQREGIHIERDSSPSGAEPAFDREGVFEIKGEENRGELTVKREFEGRGVVYADLLVTGEYTPQSRESQVEARREGDDQLVRADQGAMDTRGQTTIEMSIRSTSSELNSRFAALMEEAFPGGVIR